MVHAVNGVSRRYAASWRAAGFPLSEGLRLVDIEFLPSAKETAAGAVDNARPDRGASASSASWTSHCARP